ncbi:MAG: hypothetical protein WBA99_11555 [Nodosilinea sp.]
MDWWQEEAAMIRMMGDYTAEFAKRGRGPDKKPRRKPRRRKSAGTKQEKVISKRQVRAYESNPYYATKLDRNIRRAELGTRSIRNSASGLRAVSNLSSEVRRWSRLVGGQG